MVEIMGVSQQVCNWRRKHTWVVKLRHKERDWRHVVIQGNADGTALSLVKSETAPLRAATTPLEFLKAASLIRSRLLGLFIFDLVNITRYNRDGAVVHVNQTHNVDSTAYIRQPSLRPHFRLQPDVKDGDLVVTAEADIPFRHPLIKFRRSGIYFRANAKISARSIFHFFYTITTCVAFQLILPNVFTITTMLCSFGHGQKFLEFDVSSPSWK